MLHGAGLLGYFSTHTVVNVDGVVNNRAADSILAGRLSEYMAERGCDEVLMDPDHPGTTTEMCWLR